MAIKGYNPESAPFKEFATAYNLYGPGANQALLQSIAEFAGTSTTEVSSLIQELLKRANESNFPNLLREDGTLDMGLLYPSGKGTPVPPLWERLNIVGKPDGETWAPLIIDGVWTLFCNKEVLYAMYVQLSQEIPVLIPPPRISISAVTGLSIRPESGGAMYSVSFLATYMTRYGETGASNIVNFGAPVVAWDTATIHFEEEPHSLVTHIRIYRTFLESPLTPIQKFRLIKEVKWTSQ